ncbi:transcriptional regulator, GntR family [Methylobacterium sp. 174MFSha1.1]|uniref:GntR family transcriptional regulator n=1 Tax=Methylobacterium sp. 174MFSha1.1 TaxID=1502749 RepID=UPI0008F4018D|nr:GntR family transcriptional regulator [Methylobacterium sp. 174MFSha1.1]SFU75202.1 transcriptional regulator, GntR family [Methylobacterium sp. 174MFSha1.1]
MDDRVESVDVSTVQGRVYLALQAALHQGRFVPGEAVTIRSLAQAVGTSPMPIRGVIQRLVAEKALVQLPNRTFRVAPFDFDLHAELVRIRCTVEGFAAYRAAIRAPGDLAARLREANDSMRAAIAAGDTEGVLGANRRFHFTLYEGAASPQLLEVITQFWLRSGPVMAVALRTPESRVMFEAGSRVHDRIVAAVEGRDPDAARFHLALDIRAAAAWFRRRYREGAAGRATA